MKVIFMGTPDFSVPTLRALAARHDIVAVYSQPPRPAGRGKKDRPSPVHQAAESLGLPVRHPPNFRDRADIADFAELQADVAVVVAYGLILPQALLDAPRHGCLNIHASLLPRWRGAAPIHRAIMAGDSETGVAIMQMAAGLDTGPVLLHQALPIGPTDTTADLHDRLSDLGAHLILTALDGIGNIPRTPQPDAGVTYAAKIDKAEARIDWSRPAAEIERRIRAFDPFPGAQTALDGAVLKVWRARPLTDPTPGTPAAAPGTVLPSPDGGLAVACGDGPLALLEVQPAGGRRLDIHAFLRSRAVAPGTRLG